MFKNCSNVYCKFHVNLLIKFTYFTSLFLNYIILLSLRYIIIDGDCKDYALIDLPNVLIGGELVTFDFVVGKGDHVGLDRSAVFDFAAEIRNAWSFFHFLDDFLFQFFSSIIFQKF